MKFKEFKFLSTKKWSYCLVSDFNQIGPYVQIDLSEKSEGDLAALITAHALTWQDNTWRAFMSMQVNYLLHYQIGDDHPYIHVTALLIENCECSSTLSETINNLKLDVSNKPTTTKQDFGVWTWQHPFFIKKIPQFLQSLNILKCFSFQFWALDYS